MDKYRFTYQDIHRTVRGLAGRIAAAGYEPDVIVAIGSGGFIPARMLRTYLDRPILAVGVAYYDEHNKPTDNPRKVQWIEEAERALAGKRILLVDEVDDSRATLEYCVRELLSHGPASLAVVVLHNKLKEKRGAMPQEVCLYFAGLDIEDRWVCYPWDALDIDDHDRMATGAGVGATAAAKKAMRAAMKATLAEVGPGERGERSQRAASRATALPAWKDAGLVLAFLPMRSEIDTDPVIRAALAAGKVVAVPRIEGDDIVFARLSDGWESWPTDAWGIPEPPRDAAVVAPAAMAAVAALALVPGLVFDGRGGRLGRGRGYYDRFLASVDAARREAGPAAAPFSATGYGYAIQRVDEVPMGDADRRLDGLVLG